MRRQVSSWVRTLATTMPLIVIFAGLKWGTCDDHANGGERAAAVARAR